MLTLILLCNIKAIASCLPEKLQPCKHHIAFQTNQEYASNALLPRSFLAFQTSSADLAGQSNSLHTEPKL
jgi:hypothetical protein